MELPLLRRWEKRRLRQAVEASLEADLLTNELARYRYDDYPAKLHALWWRALLHEHHCRELLPKELLPEWRRLRDANRGWTE